MAQGLLIDMDGVVYGGETLIPGADVFINHLLRENIPFMFMTNNSQRTRIDVVRKLDRMGIKVKEEHIYTSAMATGKFLQSQIPQGTAYVLGEGGLLSSLHENGIALVNTDPDFVVLGEGRNFTLEMVQRAVNMILAGAKFVITNRDPSPKKKGWDKSWHCCYQRNDRRSYRRKSICGRQAKPCDDAFGTKSYGSRNSGNHNHRRHHGDRHSRGRTNGL